MREFVGTDLGREPMTNETTIGNFRHLTERHRFGEPLFGRVNASLRSPGTKVAGQSIADATKIKAASPTKNRATARPGDAPDGQGPAIMLRAEAAHRL